MNFEQLKLQIHIRGLYERLGPESAEDLIARAGLAEQARFHRIQKQIRPRDSHARPQDARPDHASAKSGV